MFFTKPTYEEIRLPFRFDKNPEDKDVGLISIEAYGMIGGQTKYCYASYTLKDVRMYGNGDYEQMMDRLKEAGDKTVKVLLKLKNGMPKDFKIEAESLAEACGDERFRALELVGYGFNDKSFRECF